MEDKERDYLLQVCADSLRMAGEMMLIGLSQDPALSGVALQLAKRLTYSDMTLSTCDGCGARGLELHVELPPQHRHLATEGAIKKLWTVLNQERGVPVSILLLTDNPLAETN